MPLAASLRGYVVVVDLCDGTDRKHYTGSGKSIDAALHAAHASIRHSTHNDTIAQITNNYK